MWTDTALTRLLGIRYPIIQGPFGGGLSSVGLAATVSELGGLGSFGAQPLTAREIVDTAKAIRLHTLNPFAINLWVSYQTDLAESYTAAQFAGLQRLFKPFFDEAGVPMPTTLLNDLPTFESQLEGLFEAKPPVFSFVFGIPSIDVIRECKRLGIQTIGTATTVNEACAIEAAGIDAVVATGMEAGGHRVSFLKSPEDSLTGTFALVQQIVQHVRIPVIAAGGIGNDAGMRAAFQLGADAVQIGTAFLACDESNATPIHKEILFSDRAADTVLTKAFTGRLARGVRSKIADAMQPHANQLAPYPLQSSFLSPLRKALIEQNKADYVTFWAGQAASVIRYHKAADLMLSLINGMNA